MQPPAPSLGTAKGLSLRGQVGIVVLWIAAAAALAVFKEPESTPIDLTELEETEACAEKQEPLQVFPVGTPVLRRLERQDTTTIVVSQDSPCIRKHARLTLVDVDRFGRRKGEAAAVRVSHIYRSSFSHLASAQQRAFLKRVNSDYAKLQQMQFSVIWLERVAEDTD
jgi:hypothetical protein